MEDRNFLISFSQTQFKEATFIKEDDKEDVYYCLGFTHTYKIQKKLIREVLNPYEFEVNRGIAHVEPSPEFTCRLYNSIRKENYDAVIQLHWHKFSQKPEFSSIDDKCAYLLQEDTQKINPNAMVVQIVFGNNSKYFKARYLTRDGFAYFNNIEVIGPDGISILSSNTEKSTTIEIDPIFEKNVLAFTQAGQEKIQNTKVAVIGAGGIGSGILYQMARIGFQDVIIIDSDFISANNCNRLFFVENLKKERGKLKAKFMAEAFKRFNPKAKARYLIGNAQDDNAQELLKGTDLIVLSVDNDPIRAVINSFAARYAKPLVNVATGIFMDKEGNKIKNAGTQIQWFLPREADYPCLKCQGSLNQKQIQKALMDESQKENRKEAGYISNTIISPEPQVMPLNGIGISIAMWQVCCWITGIKRPEPWTYYDAMKNKIINIQVKQNPDCSCCGLNELSVLATGDYKHELICSKP